jgi:antitoxin component YwqK of YwqJK toxin-antitoxin module
VNGKGKEYYRNGILEFEGEYLNGKRNGKGKEYDIYGNLIFEGEYKNGERGENKFSNYILKNV